MARRLGSDLRAFALLGAVLVGASFLQPDTSLQLVEEAGVLRACVPLSYPPLVTGDAARPGFDIGILQEIAKRMKLRLLPSVSTTMGRDFNPANWRITRAQCEIIAGGVVTSRTTRSFLETIDTGVENGWVMLSKDGVKPASGQPVGVYPGFSGLDRVALSGWLRGQGLQIVLASSPDVLAQGLKAGKYSAVVAGSLDSLQALDAVPGLKATWLPESLGRFAFGLGLWKGDVTLKRRVLAVFRQLEQDGFLAQQRERYGLKSVEKQSF